MRILVNYETKLNNVDKKMGVHEVKYKNVTGRIEQKENTFDVELIGDEDEVVIVLRLIWELAFLYDGYFYKPERYVVDGKESDVKNLYFLSYYISGKSWREAASTLAGSDKDFSESRLLEYEQFRNKGRKCGKLLKTLINSFFYLHSDGYERININHRLSLFLNMCDGLVSNVCGDSKNTGAKITKVLKENLDIKLVKEGSELLGIPKSKMYDALTNERHEIDHYIMKDGSITEYVMKATGEAQNHINLYFVYVIELALRIAFLRQIGYVCSEELKEYALNEIYDWIILQCDFASECKNNHNKFRQELKKQGIYMR